MTHRKIALVGIGKIATDQHVPAIAASPDWTLEATVSRSGRVEGVPGYTSMDEMLTDCPDVGVVSLCLPPVPRFEAARRALEAGRHVMLEKPPGSTLSEVFELAALAEAQGVTLFATWHSRMAAAVPAAKAWLADRDLRSARVTWREDVRKWHPGQNWVFEPGGMGVFDPGINGLSILTEILPHPVHLTDAVLEFPANRATPIAAQLTFTGGVSADLDWRETGDDVWQIDVETDEGPLSLRDGGASLFLGEDRIAASDGLSGEYPRLYARMAELLNAGESEVDLAPMLHVADAMTLGRRVTVEPFEF